jgi:transcriptional regulator with XRE-family HTH domain
MPKAIYRHEHTVLIQLLKKIRTDAGLTQSKCAEAMGHLQSFISDVEKGIRRLDLVQLRDLCAVLGYDLVRFVGEYEEALVRWIGRLTGNTVKRHPARRGVSMRSWLPW